MPFADPPHDAAQRRARDLLALHEQHVAGEGALKAGEPGPGFLFLGRSDGASRRREEAWPHRCDVGSLPRWAATVSRVGEIRGRQQKIGCLLVAYIASSQLGRLWAACVAYH